MDTPGNASSIALDTLARTTHSYSTTSISLLELITKIHYHYQGLPQVTQNGRLHIAQESLQPCSQQM